MNPTLKKSILLFTIIGLLFVSIPAFAALVPDACRGVKAADKCTLGEFQILVFKIINFLFGMAGIVSTGFILWGGIQMLVSGGNPDQIKSGKTTITNALLGLVIVFGSYLVVNTVLSKLTGGNVGNIKDLIRFWQ